MMTEYDSPGQTSASKDRNWGLPTKGAIISAHPEKQTFVVGEPVRILVTVRNDSARPLPLLSTDGITTYRLVAIQPNGTLAQKSERLLRAESTPSQAGVVTRSMTTLAPNTEATESLDATELVQLPAGEYQIVVIRKTVSWEDGFLFSNPIRIHVVKP